MLALSNDAVRALLCYQVIAPLHHHCIELSNYQKIVVMLSSYCASKAMSYQSTVHLTTVHLTTVRVAMTCLRQHTATRVNAHLDGAPSNTACACIGPEKGSFMYI